MNNHFNFMWKNGEVLITNVTSESNEIVHSGVSSFIIIGNSIIFLSNEHTLYELNLNDHSQTILGKNISEFSYNGKLWIQNNEKVYTKFLDKNTLNDFAFDNSCNRLLGVSEIYMYVESSDGIYACNVETHTSRKISEGTFVGGTDEMVLIFDSSEGIYQLVALD